MQQEAQNILQIITKQHNVLCIAKCKAFEEVIDTQMYGFSCKIDFAIKLGLITPTYGRELLTNLETQLESVYEKSQQLGENDETIK